MIIGKCWKQPAISMMAMLTSFKKYKNENKGGKRESKSTSLGWSMNHKVDSAEVDDINGQIE